MSPLVMVQTRSKRGIRDLQNPREFVVHWTHLRTTNKIFHIGYRRAAEDLKPWPFLGQHPQIYYPIPQIGTDSHNVIYPSLFRPER